MNNNGYTPNTGVTAPIEPGWNDPPKYSYNTQTTPNKPRNILNKRVAFPLSSATASPVVMPPVNIPPMPSMFPPAPPLHIPNIKPEETNIDGENILMEVKEILLGQLENSIELGPKANDIKRRIGAMEDMWTSGKLNSAIFVQMHQLAHALRDDEPSKADDIHRALMVDHVSAVGTWMPGIKQLIHNCIARSELLALDKE